MARNAKGQARQMERSSGLNPIVCPFTFGIEQFTGDRYYKRTSIQKSRGDSDVKVTGVLVVSLWGTNCRFWYHLGCLVWKVTIFAHSDITW